MQTELAKISEQHLQFDTNMKLLAEGTLSLSEKEKGYNLKIDLLKKEVSNLGSSIETKLESRLSSMESGHKVSASTIENQMETSFKRFND